MTKWLVLTTVAVTGCFDAPVESPMTTVTQVSNVAADQTLRNQVDILFMVDNSPSMDAMQTELKARLGDFFQAFEDLASNQTYADLHIGVVTSDYGAGPVADGGCDVSPGGQKGILQTGTSCAQPGGRYIEYAFGASGATSNLPNNDNSVANLVSTFTCMGSVGSGGCGFEHQLESVYAALHNTVENKGFLRPDALLVVVFVTNEDDGSAPPDTDLYLRNSTQYGYYSTYRQTDGAIACGMPLALAPDAASGGPLSCVSAPGAPNMGAIGKAFDVQRYIDFFTRPLSQGGIKNDPAHRVILVGIDAPATPFETILAVAGSGNGTGTNPLFVPCATASPPGCIVHLQHSCQNQVAPVFFGDPAIRIQSVINAVPLHQTTSICGDDLTQPPDFTKALTGAAALISSAIGPGCITAPLVDPTNPDCKVFEVTPNSDGSTTLNAVSYCGDTNNQTPCWSLTVHNTGPASQICPPICGKAGDPAQQYGVSINRGGTPAPAGTVAQVACSTLAIPPPASSADLGTNPYGCAL